jgi:hypothetical protein
VKAGVRAVSSNAVAGQAKPETVSATPVKAWESTFFNFFARRILQWPKKENL